MKNIFLQNKTVEGILKPESDIESKLIRDPKFRQGLFWGKPRYGHPEGEIIFHIEEVLKNIDRIETDSITRQQLRQVAFLHDTFKHIEDTNRPRDWSRHHSVLARKFAESYIDDELVLNIIEHHDEAFYSWRSQFIFEQKQDGEERMQKLLENIKDHTQQFYLFFKCDTQTGDKNQRPLQWFEETVQNIQVVTL